jgi:hypothetical protein
MSSIYGQNHILDGISLRRGDFNITRENGSYRSVNIPYFIDINKNVDEMQAVALALDHPDLPKEGDNPIPGVPLFVNSLSASIFERSSKLGYIVKVDVSCVGYGDYSGPGVFTYYFRGSNRNIETGYDYFGRKIVKTYSPSSGPDAGKTFTQYPKVDRETMDWFFYAKGVVFSNEPSMDIGKRWAMRVNEDNFLGFLPGELLCTNIEMDPIDIYNKPNKWKVQFTFHSRYEKWLPFIYFMDLGNLRNVLPQG